jgi:hypothetical protein
MLMVMGRMDEGVCVPYVIEVTLAFGEHEVSPLILRHLLNLQEKCVRRTTAIASIVFHDSINPSTHLFARRKIGPNPSVVDESSYECEPAEKPAPQAEIKEDGINVNVLAIIVPHNPCRIVWRFGVVVWRGRKM